MRAGVEHVGRASAPPAAGGESGVDRGDQRGCAVDHGRVDDLSLARALRFDQRAEHADGEVHAAAAEVADQVERRHRDLSLAGDRRERTGERDVVDVVAGHLGVGTFLAPAGHASVDDLRVALEADVRAQTEALHHAGAEALEEGVCAFDQLERDLDALGVLEVERDRAAAAGEQVAGRIGRRFTRSVRGAVDADDVGAHVGQDHAAEGARSDALEFNDANAAERSHIVLLTCAMHLI